MRKAVMAVSILMIVLGSAYVGFKYYTTKLVTEKADQMIIKAKPYAEISYGSADVCLMGLVPRLRNVKVKTKATGAMAEIDEILFYDHAAEGKITTKINVAVNGIHNKVKALGPGGIFLTELGYDDLVTDINVNYDYNPKEKNLFLHQLKCDIKDIGSIDLAMDLGKIDLDPEKIVALLFTFKMIDIKKANLDLKNISFVERLYEFQAKQTGRDIESLKNEFATNLDALISAAKNENEKAALAVIKDFTKSPGKLNFDLSPDKPVSIASIDATKNPVDLMSLLNVTITTVPKTAER